MFVKYEKANIERLEVSKCLPPAFCWFAMLQRAHRGLVKTASSEPNYADIPELCAICRADAIECQVQQLVQVHERQSFACFQPEQGWYMQRFAERVHDKFLEIDKHMSAVAGPKDAAEAHAREAAAAADKEEDARVEETSTTACEEPLHQE